MMKLITENKQCFSEYLFYKEEIPENVIQQHRYQIIRWLDDREEKSEETVTLAQFCDMLMNKPGVSREDAIRVRYLQ